MGFLKPAWKSTNILKARKAVERISDDATLFKVVFGAPCLSARHDALGKIGDQRLLAKIALSAELDQDDRRAACRCLRDQNALVEVARTAENPEVAREAWKNVSDPSVRLGIALDGRSPVGIADLGPDEIARGSDESLLLSIGDEALKQPGSSVAGSRLRAAHRRIANPPLQWSLRLEHEQDAAEKLVEGVAAMGYPNDRDDLVLVALQSRTERAAGAAVSKLPYPAEADVLRHIVRDAQRPLQVRRDAARALSKDDAVLDELCCPMCGAQGTVRQFETYSKMDDACSEGFRCSACKRTNLRYQFDCNLEPWEVPLRKFLGIG